MITSDMTIEYQKPEYQNICVLNFEYLTTTLISYVTLGLSNNNMKNLRGKRYLREAGTGRYFYLPPCIYLPFTP